MRHHATWIHWIYWVALIAALVLILAPRAAHGQPVIISVETHRGDDTLYVGERAFISFDVNGQGAQIQGIVFPLEFTFGSGSVMGGMPDDVTAAFAPQFFGGFSPPVVVDSLDGTDPDTLLFGAITFGDPWFPNGTEWTLRLHFQPLAAGQIGIDSIMLPPANRLAAQDPLGQFLPLEWHSPGITVLPCPNVLGDVNASGTVTSADIILYINCVFMCEFGPFDILELGDVNCNGQSTTADVILMVNYVFKGMPLPFCCKVLD